MKLAEGIRRHGFRKWYERALLRSHAQLALCFCCLIGIFAAFEASRQVQSRGDQLIDLLAIGVCGACGLWSLRRYLFLLTQAEFVAKQADCPGCGTYARFLLVSAAPGRSSVSVQCRQCSHAWEIDEGDADRDG